MTRTVQPGALSGSVRIPASKSQAHRLLICAALGAVIRDLRHLADDRRLDRFGQGP